MKKRFDIKLKEIRKIMLKIFLKDSTIKILFIF